MNLAQTLDSSLTTAEQTSAVVPIHLERAPALHRLAEARRQEDISLGNVARHLGITTDEVRRQERKTTDLPLSVLRKWANALGLPVAELVEEPDALLSTRLSNRAGLVRVMKTAMAILERSNDPPTNRLVRSMVDQLLEIMPELRGVGAWNSVGKRRGLDELGIAAERRLSDDLFVDARD